MTEIGVWLAEPRHVTGTVALDAAELTAAGRFLDERDRRAYVAAHTLLRHALTEIDGRPPHSWRFRRPGGGHRPMLADETRLRFSLARRRGLVAVAVATDFDVGIDVEDLAGADAAREVLGETEDPCADWTAREARLKVAGVGLGHGFGLPAANLQKWTVEAVEAGDWHRAAVAYPRTASGPVRIYRTTT